MIQQLQNLCKKLLGSPIIVTVVPLVSLAFTTQPISASEALSYQIDLSAGLLYESSLVVEELDLVNNSEPDSGNPKGDEALSLEANAGLSREWDSGLVVDAHISITDSRYQTANEFDLNNVLLMSSASYDIERITASLSCFNSDSSLGGVDFLNLKSCSPSASMFFSSSTYLQTGFSSGKKNFKTDDQRDADYQRYFASVYYFIDSTKNYFTLTLGKKNEDSNSREFNFRASDFELNWINKKRIFDKNLRLKLGLKTENRDYQTITQAGEHSQRKDKRTEFYTEAKLELNKDLYAQCYLRSSRNNSNDQDLDYKQNSIELRLGFTY